MADPTIRPADPTLSDGASFAHYFNTASDGLGRWMFGPRFEKVIATAFVQPGHDLSFEHVRFVTVEGALAGMVNDYSAADHARSKDGPMLRAAGIRVPRMLGAWALASQLFAFMDHLPEGDWYVQAVAVDPEFRGSGIGSLLLEDAERRARAAGARRLALDVAVDNDGAKRLYARRGMTVVDRSPTVAMMGGAAIERMVKAL